MRTEASSAAFHKSPWIDEADNATMPLGSFLKTLSERLARGGDRLMFGLGGLPAVLDVLHASHESSLRLFEGLFLAPLTTEEVVEVIDISLQRAQRDNATDYQITAEATDRLIELSDGVPHFIQQFGYSAFDADTDSVIDEADVLSGALDEHGAVNQVGYRYFRGLFSGIDGYERALLKAVAAADGERRDLCARQHHRPDLRQPAS